MLKILALHCILCLLAIWIAEAEDKDAEFDRITNNFRSFLENTTDEQMKGTAEQIDFEALGVPGINYNMNGTRPYIICDYLNVSECDPKLNPNCPTQRECYGFKDHPVLSCLTVFQYHPTLKEAGTKSKHLPVPDSSVVMMGCMGFKKDSAHFCDNKCDAVSAEPSGTRREGDPASSPPGPGYGWCCCHSHNCNGYGKVKAQNPFFPTPKGKT